MYKYIRTFIHENIDSFIRDKLAKANIFGYSFVKEKKHSLHTESFILVRKY